FGPHAFWVSEGVQPLGKPEAFRTSGGIVAGGAQVPYLNSGNAACRSAICKRVLGLIEATINGNII
ncbi:MAG: hypothetical protein LC776_13715, partial [Acidobacteria bacterium]|nr:hypothetical protein [Acidobacteriota bacterium]